MMYKALLLNISLFCLSAAGCLAQTDVPSIAIRTDSGRDSLIFRVRMEGQLRFRIYFEDRLQADVPPFQEKHYAIQPQREWSCVGVRQTDESMNLIIFGDCEQARGMNLSKLYKASDISTEPLI
jgi:hypothetical protein